MSTIVGRNDPCPCGSGLKYKQCCAGKMRLNMSGRRGWILGAIGLGVVAIVAWGLMRSQSRPAAPTAMGTPLSSTKADTGTAAGTGSVTSTSQFTVNPAPAATGAPMSMTAPAGVAPQAWTYDAQKNQHWDPGHGHWHSGPAPPPEARGASNSPQPSLGGVPTPGGTGTAHSGPTPAPWTYDAQKNQHWDPGHGHWHQGPPPAGAR